jgi:hypothetical protein
MDEKRTTDRGFAVFRKPKKTALKKGTRKHSQNIVQDFDQIHLVEALK